jgi:hypothetical protein
MKTHLAVLKALAELYENSKVGRTGQGTRDYQPDVAELLAAADAKEGDSRELAERHLRAAEKLGLIKIDPVHPRDRQSIGKIRLSPRNETAFYSYIDQISPTVLRERWSALFVEASGWRVREEFAQRWVSFCQAQAKNALSWQNMSVFRREEMNEGRELLQLTARLLNWQEEEHYIRSASCRLCGLSKTLERKRRVLEILLQACSDGQIVTLRDINIMDMPRHALIAGPIRLSHEDGVLDFSHSRDGIGVSETDINRSIVQCAALRCVTVENKTSFLQRALMHPDDLHVHTSYPNAATIALLKKLPPGLEYIHCGDSDPAGFDILRELREATGLPIRSQGMCFHSTEQSDRLNKEQIQLLRRLCEHPILGPERDAMEAIISAGSKGAFEQEHRV